MIPLSPRPHPQLVPLGDLLEPGAAKATSGSGSTLPRVWDVAEGQFMETPHEAVDTGFLSAAAVCMGSSPLYRETESNKEEC